MTLLKMSHCDITMGNDVAREIHCDVTLGNEVVMYTYHGNTVDNDVAMNLFCITVLRKLMICCLTIKLFKIVDINH